MREIVYSPDSLEDIRNITTEEKWDIPSPYRVLTISHNYVFYFVKGDVTHIVDVFDERMDILSRLF